MSRRIGIINCVKSKADLKADETVFARDLYTSTYAKYMYWYMKNIIKPDLIFFVTAYIPNFTFIPRLTKDYRNSYFNIEPIQSFMIEDMQMHSYENNIADWSVPVTNYVFDKKSDEWIEEWGIDVDNDIIYSFTSQYYRAGYENKFKHFHQILPKDGFMRRNEILRYMYHNYYEYEGCECFENISGDDK